MGMLKHIFELLHSTSKQTIQIMVLEIVRSLFYLKDTYKFITLHFSMVDALSLQCKSFLKDYLLLLRRIPR